MANLVARHMVVALTPCYQLDVFLESTIGEPREMKNYQRRVESGHLPSHSYSLEVLVHYPWHQSPSEYSAA
jgi:hypothetical protein